MKQILVFFLALSSLLYPAHARAQDFSALRSMGKAKVLEVINPYTAQLDNGTIIRLSGIHYPDYRMDEAGELSVTALEILKNMLSGQSIEVFQTANKNLGRENRMGHQIAHLRRMDNNMWVQGTLLSLGLAQVKTSQRNPEMAADMYELESEARHDRLGLWADEGRMLTPETAAQHIGSFQVVEGEIKSVAMKKNRLYMNFGGNWREDFTVSIAPTDLRRFSSVSMDPLQWSGKRIRVRGWLKDYNGPAIEVDHPQMIEVLD